MSEQNKQKVNWGDFTPVSEVKKNNAVDWDQFTPIEKDSEQGKGFLGHAQDAGASLMKGLAAVPETIVGLADIPTGGRVGKFIEQDVGLDLKGAKEYWGDKHTDQYKAQQQEFEQADGIIDKTKVALSNPSMIFNTVVQSTPEMLLGGAAAKGLGMVSKLGAIARGALGEGAVMAGHQASAIRGETEDGLLTPEQSGLSVATGALGALFGYAGGQVARKLGFDDINTAMASGRLNSQQVAGEIQKIPFKSIPKSIIGGALTEGLLEELPQSVSEQILQNMALNKPLDEGVDSAIVMGTLAGMAMGGGMNTFSAPMNYIQNNRAYDAQQQAIAREEQAQQDIGSQIQYENGLNYTPEQIAPNDQSQATQQPASYGNEVDYASTPVSDSWTLDGEQQQSQDYGNSIEYESPEISSNLESQIQFNDTYGQDMPDPVIDYGALSPFNDAQQPIIDQTKLSERLGINPNDGPMSSAAALAVDSGASPVVQNAPPVTTADAIKHGMSEISRGMDEGARNQVAEYLRNGNTDRLTYRKEDAINAALANPNYNVQRNDDGSVTVVGVKTADGNWHGVSNESTTAQQSQAPTTSVPTQQFSLNTEAQEPTTATKPNFSSHHPAGTVTHAQDIADQALQQYSGDTSALANKSNGLFKHTPATELIYSKNSPSYSDVEVVDAGDKAIVKLTNSRTGAVEERVYPHELVRFNDFLNGNQQQVENLSNISNKNNIDTISAQTEEVEAAPLSSQIAQLEQQLSETKPVPQRNSIKKQINELKSQLENQGRASWEGMSLEQRQAVVEQIETNMPLGMRNRLPTAEWDRIGPAVKAKLIGAMGQSIQPLTNRPVSQPQIEDGSPQVSTNHPFQQYDTVAQQYGRSVSPNGVILSSDGKDTGVRIVEKKGRVHVESSNGQLLHTGADANSIGNFLEKFWGDKKSNNPSSQIDTNAHEAATSPLNDTLAPTQAQIEAGNYKKGHIRLNGLDISIENPKGSTRSGNRPDGTQWEHTMSDHYGYIKRTKGADNEHIDTYIGSNPDSDQVFIVDQLDQETGNFDEHKVMLGFDSQEEAATAYKSNFDKGWKVGPIRNMDMEQFKDWLKNEDTSKPATDNKTVKPESTGGITHIEGKQSETATNDVVEESFDKAQDNLSKANYDRMRNGLIADIEQAIQDAHQSAKTVGQDDKGNPIYEQITFDVKGDGKFNVRNDKSTLTRFLKQVKANAGFKPVSKKGSGDLRHDSNYLNPKSVHRKTSIDDIKTMLTENFDEYSMDNAYQMAKSAGIDVIFVNEPKNGIVPYFVAEQIAEVENNPFYLVLRKEEQGTSYVVVSENGTPLAESAGTMKAATEKALANIKKHGDEIILKGLRSERSRLKEQGITQNGLKAEFEKEINALFGDEIDGQNVSENVSKNTPESSEKSETNDEFESSDTQNNVSKNVIQDEDGIERIHDEDSSSENKQDNSLLDKMKAKLARLEAEFDVIFNDMPFMGHGGTPFVDNSKGRQMKRNHEKREERLQAKKREIEEQKEKISNMEHRIVSRNTPTKKSQKFLDDNPIHQGLFELEKQGLVKQWKKNPQYFFVNGMDKVALATWDGEISFAKRFPVKNKEELEKVKALIAQANELAKNNTKDYSRKIPLKPDEERKGVSPLNTTFKPLSVVSATRQVFSILEHLKIVTTQIDASVRGRIVVGWQRVGVNKVKGLDSHSFTVQVVESFDGLPSAIQEDNRYQGENGETKRYDVLGVWHNGTLYINAGDIQGNNSTQQTTFEMYEELILHEVVGHFGVQQIFGREYKTKLQQLFNALGGLEGIRKIAKDNGVDMQQFNDVYINPRMQAVKDEIYTESDVQQSLVGELFAFVAQNAKSRPFVRQKLKEAIGYIRQWFRDRGFDKFLSRYNDADLMMFLSEARKAVVDRSYFGKYKNQEFSSKNDSNTPLYSRKSGNQKTGKTIAQVREALIKRFGKATIETLEKQGKLEIIQDYQVEGVEGYYRNGKAVLVASNLTDDTIIPTFLHELGGHAGFQNMMTPEQYADLMRQFDRMVKQGNPIALEAKKLAEREKNPNVQQLEYLPYLLTEASNTQIKHAIHKGSVTRLISDLISKVKAWIYDRLGVNLNLNPNDMVALAERMVKQATQAKANTNDAENANSPLYSRQSMQDTIDRLGQNIRDLSVQSVRDKAGFKWADWLGVGLQFLGRRQLTEIYAKLLPQLSKYNELAAQMDADKNDAGAKADSIVREWSNLNDDEALADVMHDSTLAKIDPTKPYVSGDSISKYKQLRDAYNSLSPEAQAMYVKARDAYKQHYAEVHQAIKERILRSELSNQKKADLLKQMDDNFFGQVKGVYFPLARFGKYVVVMRNQNGEVESVSRAETMGEAQALRSELMKKYPHFIVSKVKLDKEFNASRDAVSRGFMSSLFAEVDNLGLSTAEQAEFEDTLSQLYLSSMPDLSWAKHGIHRKGTAGFSDDARRAFAQNMFSGANYLAKLRYGDQLAQQLDEMQKYADEKEKQGGSYDQPTAQRVIDEMNKRHDNLMNPKGHPLSSALTSLGFIYYLGLSPAAAMVNLSQTALVAYPLMGAKWDFDKAGKELLKAAEQFRKSVEFHKVKWQGTKTDLYKAVSADISKFLNEDEKKAYQKAVDSGVIDVTQAHDLAGIAQGEDSGVMWKTRPIMRAASVMFHSAERFNREVTFIAAYRLARQHGADHNSAFDQAVDMTYKGHFDYSSGNRPRIMQGNVAKVVLLFKQFGQNMLYTLARQTYQSIKGETKEERREARRAISAILAMHATFAGALGLPGVWLIMAIASWMGGDDDEPWNAEVALRNYLAEAFNPTISNMLMKGAPRGIGVDISSRVGINNLLVPDVQEGLEGKKLWDSAASAALGPIGGIGANIAKGAQEISEGHNLRGVESMLPVFLKNFAKTYRYADEGVQDKTGVSILDEVDSMDLLVQSMGFSPADVRTANEGKSAIYQYDRKLSERRSRLMTLWSRAKMLDDQQEMDEIWEEIQGFNEKNPSLRITRINLNQSYRQRQRRIDRAEDGIYLPRNRQDARDAGYFAFGE